MQGRDRPQTLGQCRRTLACPPGMSAQLGESWDLFVRIQPLLFKAEALDLVEVRSRLDVNNHSYNFAICKSIMSYFEGEHIVSGDASDCLICGVFRSEESQSSFAGNNLTRELHIRKSAYRDISLLRKEFPRHGRTCARIESAMSHKHWRFRTSRESADQTLASSSGPST